MAEIFSIDSQPTSNPLIVEKLSKNGNKYYVKYNSEDDLMQSTELEKQDAEKGEGLSASDQGLVKVDWLTNTSANFDKNSQVRNNVDVTWYEITESEWWQTGHWHCAFETTDGNKKMWFLDESGDEYFELVANGGKHSFGYRSDRPTIQQVRYVKSVGSS